jgi:hypothetical protein
MQPVATSATASKHDEIISSQINKLGGKKTTQSKYTSKNASSNLRHFGVLERDVSVKGFNSEVIARLCCHDFFFLGDCSLDLDPDTLRAYERLGPTVPKLTSLEPTVIKLTVTKVLGQPLPN